MVFSRVSWIIISLPHNYHKDIKLEKERRTSVMKSVCKFNPDELKQVKTVEKIVLPSAKGLVSVE